MRLIDAEKLREQFIALYSNKECLTEKDSVLVECVDLIDNAPTVEQRPHGKWNYIQSGMCVCPFCGAMPHKLYKNYCAKCGADMRQEESE